MTRGNLYRLISCIIALNYFAFRVELFEEEHEANSPKLPDKISFSNLSINWETFDKDNASKAFVFSGEVKIEFIYFPRCEVRENLKSYRSSEPVRDKSPPLQYLNCKPVCSVYSEKYFYQIRDVRRKPVSTIFS